MKRSILVTLEDGTRINVHGFDLIFGECKVNPSATKEVPAYAGFNWVFLPSFNYCANPDGLCRTTCAAPCSRNDVNYSGACVCPVGTPLCPCNNTYAVIPIPAMMIYTGNLDLKTAPLINKDIVTYGGLFGFNALFRWLIDNDALVLFYGNTDTKRPIVITLRDTIPFIDTKFFGNQYVDLDLYNAMTKYPLCDMNGTVSMTECYPL
jgi:hypothetical protein